MSDDTFKGYWHMGVAIIAGVTAAHNLMRWCVTGHVHNVVNITIFGTLTIYECWQAGAHLKQA